VTQAWLNRIGTAVPQHDIHSEFVEFARMTLLDPHQAALFDRMAMQADIEHRYSFLEPGPKPRDRFLDAERFYERGAFPSTAARMARFEPEALQLALRAIDRLDIGDERALITHLVVVSCTGFTAPGLDFHIMRAAGLNDGVERSIIGFMGCFAAVNGLKFARHIVRSEPQARVLLVNLELSSLHLQEHFQDVPKMLGFLLFGDGASAALVTAEPGGVRLDAFRSAAIPNSAELITWTIGDQGFSMHLSGQVPGRIRRWLPVHSRSLLGERAAADIDLWAVHAGGRSILDAVQQSLALPVGALHFSRGVLRDFGNMSSATLMFVLQRILACRDATGTGLAVAFGPGLTVESFTFERA
jgi:predicted naringenin-chalcone synthase